mmetsp:Transcript_29303/g.47598  ORF Transcript_29303/g.47598 Transcript_29303/m.47598 type:complete len:421 (-) Transcript_29303:251-1513(-)
MLRKKFFWSISRRFDTSFALNGRRILRLKRLKSDKNERASQEVKIMNRGPTHWPGGMYNNWERAWINVSKGGGNFRQWMIQKRRFSAFGYEVEMSASEICGHASFGMLAISYAESDMLALRAFAIASIGSMMAFNYWHPVGFPLWLPFRWNALFLAINLLWVGDLYYKSRMSWIDSKVNLDEVHRHVFPSLQKTDFASLMKTAVSEEYTKGTELTKENALNDKVFLIVNGKVTVTKGGKPLYNLTTCQFVGTLGVHTSLYIDKSMSSTEVTSRTLRCLVWSKDDLARAVEGNSRLLAAVDAALSIDELRKTFAAADPAQHELKDGAKTESGRMYDVLVQSMMKEETSVSNRTKNALRRFRILYNVGYDRHVNALQKSGWSEKQYKDGFKSLENENVDAMDDHTAVHNPHHSAHTALGEIY